MLSFPLKVHDEVWGYISLTEFEKDLIDTSLFQRLNHIRQLGSAYRVFPGAQHTRFAHSLGVLHVLDRIITSDYLRENFDEYTRRKLRIAALLHDIGHFPFSHTIEKAITDKDGTHLEFGEYIIKKTCLADKLRKESFDPDDIIRTIKGDSPEKNGLCTQLISSDLDADRIDYLMRDAVHTGVAYGRVDINRIFDAFRLDKEGHLSVHTSGKHAAENYVIGRYHMWATVYTHRVVNGFCELLQHAYCELMDAGKVHNLDELTKLSEFELSKYDDNYLLSALANYSSDKDFTKEVYEMWRSRIHLEAVDEAQKLTEKDVGTRKYFKLDEFKKDSELERLAQGSKVPKKWIFHNNSDVNLPRYRPLSEPLTTDTHDTQKEMLKTIYIVDEEGNSKPLTDDNTSLVYYLKDMGLSTVRIYTKQEYKSQLKDTLAKMLT